MSRLSRFEHIRTHWCVFSPLLVHGMCTKHVDTSPLAIFGMMNDTAGRKSHAPWDEKRTHDVCGTLTTRVRRVLFATLP